MKAAIVQRELKKLADPRKAKLLQGFFKTGPGQYGEGDIFLGIMVPSSRTVARKFSELPFGEIGKLFQSPIHEERLVALLILVERFRTAADSEKKNIFNYYLRNTRYINNWDLVDLSAHHIVGAHLLEHDKRPLYQLARSSSLWERRISIVATAFFISNNSYTDTLKIAKILLKDKHDLIHKAVGWMLREVGKRDMETEEQFLVRHYRNMPRTMLRYAIEKFPESKRQKYLKGKI